MSRSRDRKAHWDHVYLTKAPDQVSWFQPEARLSRDLIARLQPDRDARIIDIGAGASMFVDGLLADGYRHITVVDISGAALGLARQRLGDDAGFVDWITADLLEASLPPAAFDVWHDRAVFHFLTDSVDRERYVAQVKRVVRRDGLVILATFAEDGPLRCSGLPVARYSPAQLQAQFGDAFCLVESQRELHTTPSGVSQAFTYCACRFKPHG